MLNPAFQDFRYDNTPSANIENKNRRFSAYWSDEAFTQSDLVSTNDDRVQELIHQIRKSPFISIAENLANQLITLFNFAKEEAPASLGISVDSLANFYNFLEQYATIMSPSLSLTPDHNIYASWRSEKRTFSAHFLTNGDIRFVLFKPNSRHPNRKIRINGTVTADTLTEIVDTKSLKD